MVFGKTIEKKWMINDIVFDFMDLDWILCFENG